MDNSKVLLGAANMLASSARSLDMFAAKMEEAMKEQASAIDRLIDKLGHMGKGGAGGGVASKAADTALGGFSKNFKNLTDSIMALGEGGDKVKQGFKALTEGIKDLNRAMALASKIPEKSVDMLAKFISNIADKFENINFKQVKEGGEALSVMARGLAVFGLALAASSVVYAVAAIGSLIIIPMIAGYSYVFALIGKAEKPIKAGAEAMLDMGLGILAFGLGIFAVKELAGGNWSEYAKGSLIVLAGIAIFGVAFSLLGEVAPEIDKGAEALLLSGLALASLALGIASFQLLKIDITSVLVAGAAVAVVGLAFGLIGEAAPEIAEGAIAMIFMGASIAVLALGLAAFRLLDIGFKEVLVDVGILAVIGGAFMLAGVAAPLILLGSAAMITAGVSMLLLSLGLMALNAVYIKAENGILGVSKLDPSSTNIEVTINGVTKGFWFAGLMSPLIILGGAAMITAGVAMLVLSVGLVALNWAYNKAITEKNGMFTPDPAKPKQLMIETMMDGIVKGFTINPIKSAFMIIGAAALITSAVAMIVLSGGIALFNLTYNKSKDMFGASEEDKSITKFEHIFNSLVSGLVINPFKLAGLYLALPAWIAAGIALITIGAGLGEFQKLIDTKVNMKTLEDNVQMVLTSVAKTFASIGETSGETSWFSKSKAQKGVDAVAGIGNTLMNLAQGVQQMADLKFPIYDKDGNISGYFTIADAAFAQVATNIQLIIGAIGNTLSEVGAKQGNTGWFSKSDADKGKEAIQGIGQDLVGLADFVQKVANLSFPKYDENGKEVGRITLDPKMLDAKTGPVTQNIIAMISAMAGALAAVGKGDSASKSWFGFGKSDIDKGKAAIQGIGQDVSGIADMVSKLADIKDWNQTKSRITDVISTLFQAIANIQPNDAGMAALGELVGYMEKLAATSDPITKLASAFDKISKSMEKFISNFKKMDQQAVKTSDMLIQSLVVFSKVDPNAFSANGVKAQELLTFVIEKKMPNAGTETAATPTPAAGTAKSLPGSTPVTPAPAATKSAPAANGAQQENAMLKQMITDLSKSMGDMATAMSRIEGILNGTLKVEQVK